MSSTVTVLGKITIFYTPKVTVIAYGNGYLCDLVTFFKRNKKSIKSDGKIGDGFYVHDNRYHITIITVFNHHF